MSVASASTNPKVIRMPPPVTKIGHEATVTLQSLPGSSYSQSLPLDPSQKLPRESHDAFEKRIWRSKAHWDDQGRMVIPGTAFTGAMIAACQKFGHQVPGRGRKTYTGFFEAGVSAAGNMVIEDANGQPVTQQSVDFVDLLQSAQGKKGKLSGSRVWRRFPVVHAWSGTIRFSVLDDTITEEIFSKVMTEVGLFVGIGRWRPENGGNNGRFGVEDIDWS